MDYNDYTNNNDNDRSYDVENDEHDDEELYDLVVVGCHITVMTYYMKYIDKEHCRDFEQIGYRWLMDCLSSNEAKCHYMF